MHKDDLAAGSGQLAEADWLARYVRTDGGGNLINSIADLVRSGRLQFGARLPTVRVLAEHLQVSPGTVAAAWSKLREQGLIETRRRGGTSVVYDARDERNAGRYETQRSLDLAQGLVDTALLPDLGPALLQGLRTPSLHGPAKEHVVASLLQAVAPTWPFKPQAWSTASSGTEGALLAVQAATRGAHAIAVESPTSPRLLDICTTLRLRVIAVHCDEQGPVVDALHEALLQGARAFLYQPRAQIPLGHTVSAKRTEALGSLLKSFPQVNVVEDDNLGPLARHAALSLGGALPEQVLYVRTYCNAYGIDLRTCIVGGASHLIDGVRAHRSFGAAMNSRILQGALAFLIADEHASHIVEVARDRYAARRVALTEALRARGFDILNQDGLGLWLAVKDETRTIVELAAHGISVGAGSRCYTKPPEQAFLRIATSRAPDDPARAHEIADVFSKVVRAQTGAEL